MMNLSTDAKKVAHHLCDLSQDGCPGSEQFRVADIQSFLGMKADDLTMALDELEEEDLIVALRALGEPPQLVQLEWSLFFLMDQDVKGWKVSDDAVAVARFAAGAETSTVKSEELASQLDWSHRRLNPATHHLVERGVVDARSPMTKRAFYYPTLTVTTKTQRFVRDS